MDFTKLTELNIGGHQLVSLRRASDGKVLWERRGGGILFLASNDEWQEFSYNNIKKYQGDNHTLNYRGSTTPYTVQNPFQLNPYLSSDITGSNTISNVYAVEIQDEKINSVGNYAFYFCSNLFSINCPNVSSIGNSAFSYCSNLSSADIPNVTSIGSYVFHSCSKLQSINCPNVTSIGIQAFFQCSSLYSIDIPKVTSIGTYTFYSCSSLSSINCPNVTSIGNYAFYQCSKLSLIDFSQRTSTTIPTLVNTNAFQGIQSNYEILVPPSLYDSWITATNWSSVSSHIVINKDYEFDISKLNVLLPSVVEYDETIHEYRPVPVITGRTKSLVNNVDFECEYQNNTGPGTATCIISGKGQYHGRLTKTFNISRPTTVTVNISSPNQSFNIYSGTKIPSVNEYTIDWGD